MSRANIVVRNIIFTHGEGKARNINYGLVINCIHHRKTTVFKEMKVYILLKQK